MVGVQDTQISPFLDCGAYAQSNSLAVLHLKRDLQIHTLLRETDDLNEGYDEGKVTNSRFGSFPHSTLIGVPWGSQVRASAVDTGSRGRKGTHQGKKRKRDEDTPEIPTARNDELREAVTPKAAVAASTGFAHLLPPTPESWTISLPHRTQVVYTPDYSYILQRLRVRPGSVMIEAGAGSGSFTHAAARAVFNGYPEASADKSTTHLPEQGRTGKVWSYEFHEQRVEKLKAEIHDHGLNGLVEITHRDVCADGFSVEGSPSGPVRADAIFLDLPAPWLALKHLQRSSSPSQPQTSTSTPLSPLSAVRLCTFSPCIEQVQRTITTLRALSWLEIECVEISAKRLEIKRERVGLHEEGLRGVNASPASVAEAVQRLTEIEARMQSFFEEGKAAKEGGEEPAATPTSACGNGFVSKQQRLEEIKAAEANRKLYKEGRLVHRTEPELKNHTSYLVFAVLPREWTAEDEARAMGEWRGKAGELVGMGKNKSRRQGKNKKEEVGGTAKKATAKTTEQA